MSGDAEKRTALVLAGGGSFGAVQAGMLRALVAYGIVPDLVVGSSVGAINGAYFAGVPNPEGIAQLEAIWRSLRRREVFPVTWRSLRGSVRLSSGPALQALLASCAIPAAFPPVRIGERYLIDGAVASNTPISIAVELGARRVLVLPTGFACALEAPPRDAIGCALHALTLLIAHQLVTEIERCREQVDIITVPPLCPLSVSPYDFSHTEELIERAADQTRRWLGRGGLTRERVPGALRGHTH